MLGDSAHPAQILSYARDAIIRGEFIESIAYSAYVMAQAMALELVADEERELEEREQRIRGLRDQGIDVTEDDQTAARRSPRQHAPGCVYSHVDHPNDCYVPPQPHYEDDEDSDGHGGPIDG